MSDGEHDGSEDVLAQQRQYESVRLAERLRAASYGLSRQLWSVAS
jgi:hypothetical protein